MLKSHTPETRSAGAKKKQGPPQHNRAEEKSKLNYSNNHQKKTSTPASKPKPTSKVGSPAFLRKQDFEQPTTESLQHILGILEQEYRDSKT
jgi:hypothetical protein